MLDDHPEDWQLEAGPLFLCLDAMTLIGWNKAGELDLLGQIVGKAYTAHVLIHQEIVPSLGNYPENQAILDADWLVAAPVRGEEDAQKVSDLLRIWKSEPGKDRGEAEIVVLSERWGWTAITDDTKARGVLRHKGLEYGYGATMLIAAAASGKVSTAEAWRIHQIVEGGLERPHILHKARFEALIVGASKLAQQGRTFEQLAGQFEVDRFIDKSDGRDPIRWK